MKVKNKSLSFHIFVARHIKHFCKFTARPNNLPNKRLEYYTTEKLNNHEEDFYFFDNFRSI